MLNYGLLATETSLKARIDATASKQFPFSFRLVLKVPICEICLFLPYHKIHTKYKTYICTSRDAHLKRLHLKMACRIGNSTNDTIGRAHNNIYYKTEDSVKAVQNNILVYIGFSINCSCHGSL